MCVQTVVRTETRVLVLLFIRAQIAADRAEKEARAALLRGEEPPASQAPVTNAAPAVPQPSSSRLERQISKSGPGHSSPPTTVM